MQNNIHVCNNHHHTEINFSLTEIITSMHRLALLHPLQVSPCNVTKILSLHNSKKKKKTVQTLNSLPD